MMKINPTKICACEGCDKIFKIYKTTDKFCSPNCAYKSQKSKPKQSSKAIKPVSDKRKAETYIYKRLRKAFLAKPENALCPVARLIFNEQKFAKEIHHKAGRKGKLLNYKPLWLAVSRKGHIWIHDNPSEAYKLGFLIKSTTVSI